MVLGAFLIALLGCSQGNTSQESSNEVIKYAESSKSQQLISPDQTIQGHWMYEKLNDEMRGTSTLSASLTSSNQFEFAAPYNGGTNLTMEIEQDTINPPSVMFTISKGRYACNTALNNCYASIKFDDHEIEKINLAESAKYYSADTLYIMNPKQSKKFIQSIATFKKVIIELPFAREGRKQFTFNLPGLNWNMKTMSMQRDASDNIRSHAKMKHQANYAL